MFPLPTISTRDKAARIERPSEIRVSRILVVSPTELPSTLKAIRRMHGLTLRSAADLAGVSAATFSRAERYGRTDVETLLRLSSFVTSWARRRRSDGNSMPSNARRLLGQPKA
jgi:hypothetical protein